MHSGNLHIMLSHIAIKIHCLISRCSFPLSFFLSLKFMSILRGLILSSLLSYCISCLLKRSGLVSLGFSIHTDNQSRSHLNSHHATACVREQLAAADQPSLFRVTVVICLFSCLLYSPSLRLLYAVGPVESDGNWGNYAFCVPAL